MAPTRGTPTRPIRVDPDTWERFGKAAGSQGADRSSLIREFIAWYLRVPGAKMPQRPPVIAAGEESP
ncbi:CopG family transcriptional regulator [Micromonospora costi]|uniref:ribbon-helix-helix domain-containing protein n=1 Tax=Micromonospora costi TaxID=1530042 RepID=UPI003409B48F